MATGNEIQKTIAILLAAYPSANSKDRDAMGPFLRMVEQMLAPYPVRVLEDLISPRFGIIGTSSFFPSIAELKQFCDRAWNRLDPPNRPSKAPSPLQLEGPEEDPEAKAEERKRVIEGFKNLVAELKSVPDPFRKNQPQPKSKVEEKAEAEAWLSKQAEFAKSNPLPKLSDSAMRAYQNSLMGGHR